MLKSTASMRILAMLFCGCLFAGAECPSDPNNNNNNNNNNNGNNNSNGNVSELIAVITDATVHNEAAIVAGDDVIAFGTDGFSGVQFIVPSAGDTTGRDIPDGEEFAAGTINVVGKKIICYKADFTAHVYDTESDTLESIPEEDIRLINIPIEKTGKPQSGDGYVVVRCDPDVVTDGNLLKMIDVTGDTPAVVPFTSYPVLVEEIQHAAVDRNNNTVVAVAGSVLLVFDAAHPDDAPVEIDTTTHMTDGTSDPVDNDFPIYADDGWVIFVADSSGITHLLNTETLQYVPLSSAMAAGDFDYKAGSYGFFLASPSIGNDLASGIGTLESTATTFADENDLRIENTTNGGAFGFAQEMEISQDGSTWFICGSRSLDTAETLQVSTGGKFAIVPDPAGVNELGVPASDVSVSANVVAFKTGEGTDTKVAYVIIE